MKTEHLSREEGVARLRDLLKNLKVAMLTTVDADGSLRSRPMATQQVDFDGELWFLTDNGSPKVDELRHDRRVNVSFSDPESGCYISISGQAELVRDPAKAETLWNPLYEAWFPGGLSDPSMALLKVEPDKAEFWDAPEGKMVQFLGVVKAAATGNRYEGEGSEDVKVDFKS